tara:strand:- start:3730 stop:5583 length:1854 start_codon:yes stop_codon:yes gene_type:complete
MAEQENILTRLGKLFQNQIVVRKTDSGQVKVKDVNFSQQGLTSNFIDRYSRLMSQNTWGMSYSGKQNAKNSYDVARRELFRDYELMDADPIISSALDVYSDESTTENVENKVLKIKSDNPKVTKILHNLFYDILNIEFNLWPWIRNLTKYGDFYLYLEILDKHGIVNIKPLSPYEVYRLENHDAENPRLVQFEIDQGNQQSLPGNKVNEMYENYEVAHFRLLSDSNFLPYGKSMLEGARRVWKQLTLMEDAMLIHRIMRAPEKRIFKLDIGNIPPNEVDNFMQQIINKMKKTPVIDQKTGDYNLRYNIESTTEDYFLPVRGGDSGTNIETLNGLSNDGAIDDIEYLRNKMMAALKIPKAFLGYDENIGSKATLAAEDVRFARTIERLQKIVCAELEKIAIVHLYTQGFDDAELINFELQLTNPSMIHQQEKLELLAQQKDIANDLMENKIMSREWIYNNIFDFNEQEKKDIFDGIVEDAKQKFRFEQIETEGNDPVDSGESVGTPADMEAMSDDSGFNMARRDEDWGGDRRSGTGEKEYGNEYDADDIKDATKKEKERYGKREFKGKSPLATSKGGTIVAREGLLSQLKNKFGNNIKDKSILSEENILKDEERSDKE